MATVPIIHFPVPAEFTAPAPSRQGIVHNFYYTGSVSDPVWYDSRYLWRVRLRWGVTSIEIANQVREEASKLIEAGKGIVTLFFPYKVTPFRETVKITVDYKAKTITFPDSTFAKMEKNAVVQVGQYALYPLTYEKQIEEERSDFYIRDELGRPILEEASTTIKYLNMPLSGLTNASGQAQISQGDRYIYIAAKSASIQPPEVTHLSRYQARVGDITIIESE